MGINITNSLYSPLRYPGGKGKLSNYIQLLVEYNLLTDGHYVEPYAGGASVATRIRRLDEMAEIIIFEKGPHVSFSNCSLPFHLSGIVESSDELGNAFQLLGNAALAGKWLQEYHFRLGRIMSRA